MKNLEYECNLYTLWFKYIAILYVLVQNDAISFLKVSLAKIYDIFDSWAFLKLELRGWG